MDKEFVFVGCSFTVGEGLPLEKDDPDLYANIVSSNFSAKIKNLSVGGNSNYNIFTTAMNEILFNTPDKIFIQWSGLNRLWLYPGPDTNVVLSNTVKNDYQYRNIRYSKKELQEFINMYNLLNHDYHNLIVLINYCKILTEISKNKTQIIFINGLVPWTNELMCKTTTVNFAENLSDYSKEIFEFDSRDDEELIEIFKKLNLAIADIDKLKWVNMFNSMLSLAIDVGNDAQHPGPESHRLYADMIIKYLEDNNDKRI